MKIDDNREENLEQNDAFFEKLQELDASLQETDPDVIKNVVSALLNISTPEENNPTQSGDERMDQSVEAAGTQMDRGESWEAYSQVNMEQEIPLSVEERADIESQRKQEKRGAQGFSAGELQNRFALQSGMMAC